MKITLFMLIETWLKTRHLKWYYNPEVSMLEMKDDPIDAKFVVEKDRVVYTPTKFFDGAKRTTIMAVDPAFFQKLEVALRHEEKWSHAAKCLVLIINASISVWGPLINVVMLWVFDRIDDIDSWYRRFKRRRSERSVSGNNLSNPIPINP